MLVDDVEDQRDVGCVAGVHKPTQTIGSAGVCAGREIVQRTVAPVEVELAAGDRHQFQAIHAETLKIHQPFDDTVEGVVKLFHLQFVHDEVVEIGSLIGGIGPWKRRRSLGEQHGGKSTHLGSACERIGEPAGDQYGRCACARSPPKLESIQVNAFGAEGCAGDRIHGNGAAPEVEWMACVPREFCILRLNCRVEAVVFVNDAHHDVEAVGVADSRQVDAKADLETGQGCRGKCPDFGKIDHKCDPFSDREYAGVFRL